MSRDAKDGRGRWKSSKAAKPAAGRKQAKKWTAVAILGTLLGGAALGAVYLFLIFVNWFQPRTQFVPFWVGGYDQPRIAPIAWIDADRTAIREGKYFRDLDEADFNDPNYEVMAVGLDALAKRKPNDSVVVHFSGHAIVSGQGDEKDGPVRILAKDSNPGDPGTMHPLRSILEQFARCPSRKKLLILDVMKPRLDLADLGGMGTSDGVSDLIRSEVDRIVGDKNATETGLILAACAEGQSSVEIDSLGGSLFNQHFCAGLEDPAADANRNGQITVKELAAYLARMVDRDAFQYRGLRQTPELLGRGPDFALVSVGAKRRVKAAPGPTPPPATKEKGAPAAEEDASKKGDPGKAKAETKERDPDRAKPAGKEAPAEENPDPRGYPSWLAAEWAEFEALRASGDYVDTPRPFRTLEARLLRAEHRWRGGGDPAAIRIETEKACGDLKAAMKQVREARWLTPRSVGQARSLGWKPDDALVAELKATLRRRRDPDTFAKPEQQAETLNAAVKAFLAKLKGKSMLDLAGALVEALASDDERFNAATVKFADSIVDQAIKSDTSLQRDLIEPRFLAMLARRAETSDNEPWPEDTAKRAWEVVVAAERANCRPRSLDWVRQLLDQADSLRHEAEVLTLPRTAGHASWKQMGVAWEKAASAYDVVVNAQRKIDAAHATLAQAVAFLPADVPFLETSHRPDLEKIWHEAAVKTRILGDLLKPPSATPTREDVEGLNDDLVEATQSLADLLDDIQEPFSERSLEKLARDCRAEQERPDPALAVRIGAVLATPFPMARQRQTLWDAARHLDRRLESDTASVPPEPADAPARLRQLETDRTNRVNARASRLADLLRLAGDAATADDMDAVLRRTLASDPGSPLMTWRLMAVRCANVRRDLKSRLDRKGLDEDIAAWVAPVDGLNWRDHPVEEGKGLRDGAVLAWLAGRYRHEKEDARDPENVSFFRQAEGECARSATPARDLYPELSSDLTAESHRVNLSADHNQETFPFQIILRAPADAGSKTASLRVLKPDDERLRVTLVGKTEIELKPQAAQTSSIRVEWVEGGIRPAGPSSAPSGFIIQARLGDTLAYHLPIPLAIVPESERLQLALSADLARLAEVPFDIRLRAIPGRQQFFVYVKNPSAKPRNVTVEILEGETVAQATAKPLAVAAGGTVKVPAFGAAPLPKTESLHALPDPPQLQIRLKDADTGEVYQLQKIAVDIASPRDYLEDAGARFTPPQPGEPNRLELRFRARPAMMDPPAPLKMTLDKRLVPSLVGTPKELKLEGILAPGGDLALYAGGLALDPAESTVGLVPVDVDGLKRAFWFRTHFELSGGPQRAELISKPRIHFEAVPVLKPNEAAKLKVAFQVDDAPPGARLRWQLGRVVDGKVENDITPFEKPAKDRRIAFDARGAGGALLFEASVRDWEPEFDTPTIRGERRLQAKLLGPDGRTELADFTIDKMLDDRAPSEIALTLPKEVKPKSLMNASATVTPPAAGLKEVVFYYGKGNADDFKKAEADNKLYKGKQPSSSDPRSPWEAKLPVPETAGGILVVSVRALSNVDLAGFETGEVGVTASKPAVDPDEEQAKASTPKFGTIVGKVTEGDRPQPELTVVLYTYAAKTGSPTKAAEANTAKDGTYSFKDLEPGAYAVQSFNPASTTTDAKTTLLKAGETKTLDLDLKR
jgi:hypothetical protein